MKNTINNFIKSYNNDRLTRLIIIVIAVIISMLYSLKVKSDFMNYIKYKELAVNYTVFSKSKYVNINDVRVDKDVYDNMSKLMLINGKIVNTKVEENDKKYINIAVLETAFIQSSKVTDTMGSVNKISNDKLIISNYSKSKALTYQDNIGKTPIFWYVMIVFVLYCAFIVEFNLYISCLLLNRKFEYYFK